MKVQVQNMHLLKLYAYVLRSVAMSRGGTVMVTLKWYCHDNTHCDIVMVTLFVLLSQ